MRENRAAGVVVDFTSFAAKIGLALLVHCSAGKFAVLGWTQMLARELAKHGIRVNAICPGFVRTPMQEREILWEAELRGATTDVIMVEYLAQTPLGRLEEPEDIADAALFLASDGVRFITGQGLNRTGGIRPD